MADAEAVRAAREAAICDQCAVFAKTSAHDGARGRQHLWHARPALWSLIPDHHNRALCSKSQAVMYRLNDRCHCSALALVLSDHHLALHK